MLTPCTDESYIQMSGMSGTSTKTLIISCPHFQAICRISTRDPRGGWTRSEKAHG